MKKLNLITLSLLGLTTTAMAHASTTFLYEHDYEDVSKAHTDEIKLSHDLSMGLSVAVELDFVPNAQDNGDEGKAFHDERWDETALSLSYPMELSHSISVEPGFSWGRKHDELKYKPYVKFGMPLVYGINLDSRYRYEVSDYKYKATKKKNRFDVGFNHSFDKLKVGYTLVFEQGNTNLYNNTKSDYKHKVKFSYKLTSSLAPYIVFENESVSSKTSQRQTEYEIGFKYKL